MRRDVLFSILTFLAVGGFGGDAISTFRVAWFADASRSVAREAVDDDFRSVAPNEFELASDDASNRTENSDETPLLELPGAATGESSIPGEKSATDEKSATGENGVPNVETLPPEAISPPRNLKAETVVDEEERKRLERDPFFREFSAAFDETAPLPAIPNLGAPFGVVSDGERGEIDDKIGEISEFGDETGAEPGGATGTGVGKAFRGAAASPSSGRLALALDDVLAISAVDLDALSISPENRATLDRLDSEISRLCPLWLDAELNKNVVGRRERIWERDEPTRFETNEPEPVAAESDWALAPDAPFFFQVVDSVSGAVFYTKAGDFEPVDGAPALVRDGGTFVLSVAPGPGVPSGRADRTRVLIDGKIQGVDASGKRVADFNLGTIQLFLFDNPARLESADGVFFVPTPESGEPRPTKLLPTSKIGVRAGKLVLSNGRPDELFVRIVVLCKSKKRLVEILTQPRLRSN